MAKTASPAPKKGKPVSVPLKPEKKEPWECIDEELAAIDDLPPVIECGDPDIWDCQVMMLTNIIFALKQNGAPAPSGIYPYDGPFIQIEWVLKKLVVVDNKEVEVEYQRVYADIENSDQIEVTYTYPDRVPHSKTVTDPLDILPQVRP